MLQQLRQYYYCRLRPAVPLTGSYLIVRHADAVCRSCRPGADAAALGRRDTLPPLSVSCLFPPMMTLNFDIQSLPLNVNSYCYHGFVIDDDDVVSSSTVAMFHRRVGRCWSPMAHATARRR